MWGRFGRRFGLQNRPVILLRFILDGLDCDLMIRWSQDGRQDRSKRAPGGILGCLGVILGRSWELLGPIWAVLGLVLDRLGVVLEPFWGSIR